MAISTALPNGSLKPRPDALIRSTALDARLKQAAVAAQ
jgi:hypothetical protein